jgi:transposase InsO family protein
MPWKEMDAMSIRKEFVTLALQAGSNIRGLCRQYGISSRTAYKWIARYQAEGEAGLEERSRRPKHSPRKTNAAIEQKVLDKRAETGWGGRKIARVLGNEGQADVPHPNTITDILRRAGKITREASEQHRPWQHFERAVPNELWQMDYKGHFPMLQGRCHPFTVLDDHSRFCVGLYASGNETAESTQAFLTTIFRRYGLPQAILCDNGNTWGTGFPDFSLTSLTVWLIRLGITPHHGRPAHPQTQGKEERFHRTLKAEVIQGRSFRDLDDCQRHFDPFRDRYNLVRPHEALQLDTPVQHYQPSQRPFPAMLPPIEYDDPKWVRIVQGGGRIWYQGRHYRVGKALCGLPVLLRQTEADGRFDVFFCNTKVRQFDLHEQKP